MAEFLLPYRYLAQDDGGIVQRLLVAKDVTTAGVLLAGIILVTVGFLREWIVTGPQYRRMVADRDRWMSVAWSALQATRAGVQTTQQAVEAVRTMTDNGANLAAMVPPGYVRQEDRPGPG